MAARTTDTTASTSATSKPDTAPAARPASRATPDAAPVARGPVRLISRYAALGVRDLVRFQNGRATVSAAVFDELVANPAFGYGHDFWLDQTAA